MQLEEALCIPKALQKMTPCKIKKQQRIDKMLQLIYDGETDFTKISEAIGVSRNQAYKYWNHWLQTEEAAKINAEWWSEYLHQKQEGTPKAFEGLTRIKYRMTKEKIEIKQEIREIKLAWKLEPTSTGAVQSPSEAT